MKTLELFVQQIEQWRRMYWKNSHPSYQSTMEKQGCPVAKETGKNVPSQQEMKKCQWSQKKRSKIIVILAVTSIAGTFGQRFYNQPKLDVGTIAPYTIYAPDAAIIPDRQTTEENRRQARAGAIPVLKIDMEINRQIYEELKQILSQGNQIRQEAGILPFIKTSILSTNAQYYLRYIEESEWQQILAATEKEIANNNANSKSSGINKKSPEKGLEKLTINSQITVQELVNYRSKVSEKEFASLVQYISKIRYHYIQAINYLKNSETDKTRKIYDISFLDFSDKEWQEIETKINIIADRILSQGIPIGLPNNIREDAVKKQVKNYLPPKAEKIGTKILLKVIKPNLVEDKEETKKNAEQAAQLVAQVTIEIRKDQPIVEEGQTITQSNFLVLDYFNLSRRGINWLGLIGFGGLVSIAVSIIWVVQKRFHPKFRQRDRVLLVLLSLTTPLLVSFGIHYTSLPAIGLLLGSFYSSTLAVTVVALLAALLPIGMEINGIHLLASAVGGIVGGWMAEKLRSREELAMLGGGVGLIQGIVYLLLTIIISATTGTLAYTILTTSALHALGGLAWSIFALGISPYLEQLFDLVTPIRLAELANPNRPLLKRLAAEAPGTFQHTLFVASLAEAAAKELGCNVELIRAGILYHDIGKMHAPEYFIENQLGGPNKHDELNDPWKSAEIIKKHVSEGIILAKKHRLPKAIQAFIPEHQGTMLITYFYHHAQLVAEKDPSIIVREEDFRYNGPIPQSRETGIVILADACEAALRSLKDATPEEAFSMVNKIFKARWQDNQLLDSGLTKEEISQIAEIFVQVWVQYNHKRIAYPKLSNRVK